MLLLMAVVGVGLGWELSFIRARNAMRRDIKDEFVRRRMIMDRMGPWGGADILQAESINTATSSSPQIPAWRRLLGDEPLAMALRNNEADARRTLALFPEATIMYYVGCPALADARPDRARMIDKAFGR